MWKIMTYFIYVTWYSLTVRKILMKPNQTFGTFAISTQLTTRQQQETTTSPITLINYSTNIT